MEWGSRVVAWDPCKSLVSYPCYVSYVPVSQLSNQVKQGINGKYRLQRWGLSVEKNVASVGKYFDFQVFST